MTSRDNPIRRAEEDVLGRAPVAAAFAKRVLDLDSSEGLVVGVVGAWGTGKTSFINLARDEFERAGALILDFNPWMFSGAEQLVERFFHELAAQLKSKKKFEAIGETLEEYSEWFSPFASLPIVGQWAGGIGSTLRLLGRGFRRQPKGGAASVRDRLCKELAKADTQILVVLDDIDRLSTHEIRELFRLVRLTASFPNVIYVLAFDRLRVEQALGEGSVSGRDYLEKIIQLAFDLPSVPHHVLSRQITSCIEEALLGIGETGPFDENIWQEILVDVVRPLVRTMRNVNRYGTEIRGTVIALEGKVALADVLGLEAVRVFLPDVYDRLHGSMEALTNLGASTMQAEDLKADVECLVASAGDRDELARAIVKRLFPAAAEHVGATKYGAEWEGKWLKSRRVAHRAFLRLYLERTEAENESLSAFSHAERARRLMGDRHRLDEYLRSLEPSMVEDVVESLEVYEDEYTREQVAPSVVALLNLLPDMPERRRGLFDIGTRMVFSRVVYRLLRSLGDPGAVARAVEEIVSNVTCVSSALEVIRTVGHREHSGHQLVSEEDAERFERQWIATVRSTPFHALIKDPQVFWVLVVIADWSEPRDGPFPIEDSPEVTLAILKSARTEMISASSSGPVTRTPRLSWEGLVQIYGLEADLVQRISALSESQVAEQDRDVVELATLYASGERPESDL